MDRREEALDAIEEAVDILRKQATKHSVVFNPDLAVSLNNLANRLSDMGRREEALDVIQQAVEMQEKLETESPAAFALSLNNSAVYLSDMGRLDEAAQRTQDVGHKNLGIVSVPAAKFNSH